jgi:hypothetical protein
VKQSENLCPLLLGIQNWFELIDHIPLAAGDSFAKVDFIVCVCSQMNQQHCDVLVG